MWRTLIRLPDGYFFFLSGLDYKNSVWISPLESGSQPLSPILLQALGALSSWVLSNYTLCKGIHSPTDGLNVHEKYMPFKETKLVVPSFPFIKAVLGELSVKSDFTDISKAEIYLDGNG